MKLQTVTGPDFRAVCLTCKESRWFGNGQGFADTHGKPFEAYYCNVCAQLLNVMTAAQESKERKQANKLLQLLPIYSEGLQLEAMNAVLEEHGFKTLEPAIYCGRDGSAHEQVGQRTWLTFTWHKMESTRYELVAYLS
jgi:hypothetical protein